MIALRSGFERIAIGPMEMSRKTWPELTMWNHHTHLVVYDIEVLAS